ncbi:MAG: hypothetical protein ABIJ59_14935 [Pseudomonadota bacterium]
MVIHDFIYEWNGKSKDGEKPVSWWPGAYHVKIVKLALETNDISYLIPTAVILKNARTNPEMNTSLKNYIHTFAQKVSKAYGLNMEKTLWIELADTIRVTRLIPDPNVVAATMFTISWRDIRPNELEMIQPYISDM